MTEQKGLAKGIETYGSYLKFNKEMKNYLSNPTERRMLAKEITRNGRETIEAGYIPGSENSKLKYTEKNESRSRDLFREVLNDLLWYVYANECQNNKTPGHTPREKVLWGYDNKKYWLKHLDSIDGIIDSGVFDHL